MPQEQTVPPSLRRLDSERTYGGRQLRSYSLLVSSSLSLLFAFCACTAPKRDVAAKPAKNLLSDVRDHTGASVASDALTGHWSVLWFYPKAQTSG